MIQHDPTRKRRECQPRSTLITRAELRKHATCDCDDCARHSPNAALAVTPQCHPTAGVFVLVHRNEETALVVCRECREVFAHIKIAEA